MYLDTIYGLFIIRMAIINGDNCCSIDGDCKGTHSDKLLPASPLPVIGNTNDLGGHIPT